MLRPIEMTDDPRGDFCEVIDVRSPSEFAEDHVPGAINLPVLDDEERARVGTLYKQVHPFTAKKVGAALVSRNIATHLESHFANKSKAYRPLIYCWRGGQRSYSLAVVLQSIGWNPVLLRSGYKRYRTWVVEGLEGRVSRFRFRVLAGLTGSGKTALLKQMAEDGLQVLDLEGLALHRGSLLGSDPERNQPTQKRFESLLLNRLESLDPSRWTWVESESSSVGRLHIPPALWTRLRNAPLDELVVPMKSRVRFLLEQYDHFVRDPESLIQRLGPLSSRHGRERIQSWFAAIRGGDFEHFVEGILTHHYDPSYRRSTLKNRPPPQHTVTLTDLSGSERNRFVSWAREFEGRSQRLDSLPVRHSNTEFA